MKDTAFPSSSRVLRRLLQGLGVLLLSGLVAALVLLALALHDQPLVRREAASMSAEDLLRVKLLLRAADPRHPAPQAAGRGGDGTALRVLRADSRDIDLLLNDATQRLLRLPSRLVPGAGSARLQASLEMPASPFGRWYKRHSLSDMPYSPNPFRNTLNVFCQCRFCCIYYAVLFYY